MFIHEGIKMFEKIVNDSDIRKCNYFSKSSDVGETMKMPKKLHEFISILEDSDHGLKSFSDVERELAISFFSNNNYYKFSIFPKLLPAQVERTFLASLFLFDLDCFLRENLTNFVMIIEMTLKTKIAYTLSHNYESAIYSKAECYLDEEIYSNKRVANKTLNSFAETISRSKEQFILHHHVERGGCIPIWALFEELTFGQIDNFISNLNKEFRGELLEQIFRKENLKFAISWINMTRHVRNIVAHNSRIIGRKYAVAPKIKREVKKKCGITNKNNSTTFVMLTTIKEMVSFQSPNTIMQWDNFVKNLSYLVGSNEELVDFESNGFFDGWDDELIIKDKFH